MAGIHITDIEAAINYWREKNPSPDGVALPRELRALAEVYALMVYFKEDEADEFSLPLAAAEAWQAWYASTPDTPCIAICSTFQGDPSCKGCGRSFEEVQLWTEMSPGEKRSVWRRITVDGTSWRFNRYAERAAEDRSLARAAADAQVPLGFNRSFHFQRITSRCTLSLVLLKVSAPSCTVACNCMLRSASLAKA